MDVYYVKVGKGEHPRIRVGDTIYDVRMAAVILAGLEVALEDALREAGVGKCLHCGIVQKIDAVGVLHCWDCCGILSPTPEPTADDFPDMLHEDTVAHDEIPF